MTICRDDIQMVVLAGRESITSELEAFANGFDHRWIARGSELPDHLACRRNAIARWFLEETDRRWLWMLDDDSVPIPETRLLERTDRDVAAAAVIARHGRLAHGHTVSVASLKISRRALVALGLPLFLFRYDREHCRVMECECQYFWRRCMNAARRQGMEWLAPCQVGAIGHRFPVTVVPDADGRPKMVF